MTPERGEQYRFGPFQLDVTERELLRDGEVISLTAKTFDLLLLLVQRAGHTFTKSELLESLWPGTLVEESNLSQTIFLLRKALGENVGGSEYILTVPRRGYKFIGSVSRPDSPNQAPQLEEAAALPPAISRFWPLIAALAVLAVGGLAFVHFREAPPEARVVRSAIPRPEKIARYTDYLPALSPDGRQIAFAAIGEDGRSRLWIRSLDALAARPMDGTEGAEQPFWSPDSRWLGFFADWKLKKIDTRGGPAITLADAPVALGGSWGPKGVILFSPSWRTVHQISSAGGKAIPVPAAAAVGNLQCCPWFLPDGEHFLFAAETREGSDSAVKLLVGSLNSTASKVIGEAANAAYAQGRLLYLKGNTLVAQPFDDKSLRTIGEPEAVAEGVARQQGTFPLGAFAVSSTGMLAYLAAPTRARAPQLTWFDRAGKAVSTIGQPRKFYDIELSPDRKRLAASVADGANIDVWTYDLERDVPARFTFDPAPEFRGMWSPDGRSIVFNSDRTGNANLYRKSADGAGAENLLYADTRQKYPVSWSRDGKFLLFSTGGGPQGRELWVLPLTAEPGGAASKPQPFLRSSPFGQFSPDDRWVAYESDESQPSEIYVVPFSRPTERHQISANGGARPRWRQDGKEIFYLTPAGQLTAAEVTIRGDAVEVGAVRALFGPIPLGAGYSYDVSADGQRILAAVPAVNPEGPPPITLVQNWATALKK